MSDGGAEAALNSAMQLGAFAGIADEHLLQILQAIPAAVYATDAEGRITFCNDAAIELWGQRPELGTAEFCGSWKLYYPDGRSMPHGECPMAVALRTGQPVRGEEAIAERPNGTRVPFQPYPTPLFDASGNLTGAVNMLVDITERKLAEQTANRLAAIVESSEDTIISKSLDGIITSWNGSAERMFGYSAEEVIGKSISILIPAERQHEEPGILQRIRRGERIEHYETVRRRKDGSPLQVSLSVSPVKDAWGQIVGVSKIARDITARKQAEAHQALLTGELQHRTKNLFAVVHAVASRSFVGKRTVEEAQAAVLSRLRSLAQTHIMLIEKEWQGADIEEVVRTEMSPYAERVRIEGPSLILTSQVAQNFALAVHELATNAVKYGALSTMSGRVSITWTVAGHQRFTFRWQEEGGPPVKQPTQKGFGSTVLEKVMAEYFETPPMMEFAEAGVVYQLSGNLASFPANA